MNWIKSLFVPKSVAGPTASEANYFAYHRYGECEQRPPFSSFPALLDELETRLDDEEHTSVSLVHESEWALGFYRGGYVTFENVEEGEPRHMTGVSRPRQLALMEALAKGDFAHLEAQPWGPGY
ncbi:MAG: hypothetical protein KF842_05740 [Caulobacter sp.]|nr:hypothetical protein [Caulobacter sp.]